MLEEEIANIKNKLQPVSTVLYAIEKGDRVPNDFLIEAEKGLQEAIEILNKIMDKKEID